MKIRHRSREVALQALYQFAVSAQQSGQPLPLDNPSLVTEEIRRYFEHFQVPEPTQAFAAQLIAGTLQEQATIDSKIESHAHHWRMDRMALIDVWLLRMATYELMKCDDIPASVTLDEAVELAKEFGAAETPAFVNGVLDAIKTQLGKI